ncbi:collagen alpha-1(XXI) chain isoform X2 [Gasterosteus aculeatus]
MNTGRKRTTLLTIRCVAQHGSLEKAFTRYSYIKCDKSKFQRSVFISSPEQREWPLSWRGGCSLASPAANCLLCLPAQARLSTTDHLGLCKSRALGCVINAKKVGLDQGGRLSYAVMLLWSLWSAILLLVSLEAAEEDNVRAGCSTAVNDLVYIVDGSWSVGFSDFDTAKQWLINITRRFDVSSHYTQVAVIQYSDTPRMEIPLGQHQSGAKLIQAIQSISYLGGNTQTGRAIKFAVDHVFASSNRARQVKNRIAVVVTDGKSQDDVVDASVEARAQGITVFAVGVGSEITTSELVSIANRPSSAYVLYAEDYTTIDLIQGSMEQKLCEESVCPTRIPVASRDEKGFELLLGMNIQKKAKKIPGSLILEAAYALTASTDITEDTRDIFPEGLPPSYVFIATLRLKGTSSRLTFDLWRVLSKDKEIQVAVTLSGKDKSVVFTTTSLTAEEQRVTFRGVQTLYDGKWHQLKVLVRPRQVSSFLDDLLIQEELLEPVEPIYINGETQVAKRRGTDLPVAVEIQKLRLYCDPHQSERETACEIYSVDDERVSAVSVLYSPSANY